MKFKLEEIDSALRSAVEEVREESRRTGEPIVYLRDGRLVEEVPPAKPRKQVRYDEELAAPESVVREDDEQDG